MLGPENSKSKSEILPSFSVSPDVQKGSLRINADPVNGSTMAIPGLGNLRYLPNREIIIDLDLDNFINHIQNLRDLRQGRISDHT